MSSETAADHRRGGGERVGKVGEGAAVEGGIVAEGEWCMGG